MIRRLCLSLCLLLLSLPLFAKEVALNPNHPQRYVVVKGDTLWDISGKFLKYPWHWPDIWYVNPQIKNPHLIYPGDILSLVYRNGKPMLELTRGKHTIKLSPQVRAEMLDKPIPTIPLSVIGPFLSKPRVVSEETLKTAPYIVSSSDERLISGAGDKVYVRAIKDKKVEKYSVFHGGKVYKDPDTGEILGYEAIYTGEGDVIKGGDPATFMLNSTSREVQVGDRLLPVVDDDYNVNFFPHAPKQAINGRIISVYDGVSQIGQYQIVVLNKGERNNLETGNVLSVYQAGEEIKDPVTTAKNNMVTLPDEHAGEAMVFKVFHKVSYAIIMKATRAIHVGDKVESAP